MKKAIILLVMLFSINVSNAQLTDIMKFRSEVVSLYDRKSDDAKWERQAFKINQVLTLNAREKVFKVVSPNDEKVYDLIDYADPVSIKEGRKNSVFTAVDSSGDKCKIEFISLGDAIESIWISYRYFKILYVITKK